METYKNDILSLGERYAREQLELLVRLCNCNSYSYNKEGVDRVAGMLLQELAGILPLHETRDEKELGNHHILKTAAAEKNQAIYLVGHIDTVFPPDYPFRESRQEEDRLIGPGSGDMKGGLVVMVYALKVLAYLGILEKFPITMIMNSDEEIGSVSSRHIFELEREKARLCLTGECAGLSNEIVVSRNGKMGARIDSFGQGRHVGHGAAGKASAIIEIAHKIIGVESLNGTLPGVDINIGTVEGGLSSNTVPESASCLLDIRWRGEDQREKVLEKIAAITAESVQSGSRSEFRVMNYRPAMPETPHTPGLVQILRQLADDLGQEIGTEHRRGTSDANFFGSAGVPTLDGWGPVCEHDHTDREYIRISSLNERTILLSLFLAEYGRRAGMIP